MKSLHDLYQAEINGSISWFFDGVVEVRLGDNINGYKEQEVFETVEEAVDWLYVVARKHYPNADIWKED